MGKAIGFGRHAECVVVGVAWCMRQLGRLVQV